MFQFRNGAARVAYIGKGLTEGRPVHCLHHPNSPTRTRLPLRLKSFKCTFTILFPERANPVLRIAVEHDVADVEPCFDPRAVELVDVRNHFERAQQELVPHFLYSNYHLQFFGKWNKLADLPLGARPKRQR